MNVLFSSTWLLSALLLWLYMSGVYLLALRTRNNGIADIAWGPGFGLVGLCALLTTGGSGNRSLLLLGLVLLWGLRLAVFLLIRNRGRAEDWRYAAWRTQWGSTWRLRSYLQVFMLQGILLYLIALPLLLVMSRPELSLRPADAFGILLWAIGFLFEAVADAQMLRFKRNPANRGRIMDHGLWAWSRHPNYFGEALLWWGIALLALPVGPWYLVLVSPLLITYLLLRVSGVPMLERKYADDPAYRSYVKRTSSFLPMPPRRIA